MKFRTYLINPICLSCNLLESIGRAPRKKRRRIEEANRLPKYAMPPGASHEILIADRVLVVEDVEDVDKGLEVPTRSASSWEVELTRQFTVDPSRRGHPVVDAGMNMRNVGLDRRSLRRKRGQWQSFELP